MKIISDANKTVLNILKNFKRTDSCTRMMKYCVQEQVDDGILLFNLLTRELLLLSEEEYSHVMELDYLKERWFLVPENTDEKAITSFVKMYFATRYKRPAEITGYTIFPTTDCNARCFYCFELGRSRIAMTQETALKVVEYIKAHHCGKEITICWFGGEPLFNQDVMDTICNRLHEEGIAFTSKVVSNGYLFDEATVKKAVESWNVTRVQVTLDGTEEVYNRTKAFIYKEGSPYQIVLKNMERLLDASIEVIVRLNIDLYNAEDLLHLVDEVAQRFAGKKNLSLNTYHIFKDNEPMAELHSDEEWEKREAAMRRLDERISSYGLETRARIAKQLKSVCCMADSGNGVSIMPDGSIGLCQHFSDTEIAGHIDREGMDAEVVASWKEVRPEIPECADCFFYPECMTLQKCANSCKCFAQYRKKRLRRTKWEMVCEYEHWLEQISQEAVNTALADS